MSYKFVSDRNLLNPNDKLHIEFKLCDSSDLYELVESFEAFLKSCGFCFDELCISTDKESE